MISLLRSTHRRRILVLLTLSMVGFGGLAARLAYLATVRGEHYRGRANRQHWREVEATPRRGDILDRHGHALATSVLRESLYVNCAAAPREMRAAVARGCAEIFGQSLGIFERRLARGGRVPLARRMESDEAERVREMIAGLELRADNDLVYLEPETERLYPRDHLAAPMIGFTRPDNTGDNEGVTGVEQAWNEHLQGLRVSEEAFHNAASQVMEPMGPETLAVSAGRQVWLTLDSVIQRVAEDALAESVMRFEADWGTAVVLNPQSGQVLAMVNCPSFDLNDHARYPESTKRNRAISMPVDPGSVMKIFVFAAAMEEGLIDEREIIDCHGGTWQHPVWNVTVRDDGTHHLGLVPLHESFAWSSNVATVQVADRLGAERLVAHLREFGFGRRTGIALPGESPGALRPAGRWSAPDHRAIPTGQGMTMTALQTAVALGAVANGGVWQTPSVVTRLEDTSGQEITLDDAGERRRVISSLTARRMAALMEEVVISGTGDDAQVAGYRVAGKTGTADRYDEEAGGYQGYVACFAGFAPVGDPRLVCAVFVSNPNDEIGFYGGEVAGSVFQQIVTDSLRILGVPPDAPREQVAEMVIEATRSSSRRGEGRTFAHRGSAAVNASNLMPDLAGLTMREVTRRLADLDVPLRFRGTGRATGQSPAAGTPLRSVTRVTVMFSDAPDVGG